MLGIEGRREGKWEKGEEEDEGPRPIMGMVETVITYGL